MNSLTRVLHGFAATIVAAQVLACTQLDPAGSNRDAQASAVVAEDAGDASIDTSDATWSESDVGDTAVAVMEGDANMAPVATDAGTTEASTVVSESCSTESALRCAASAGARDVCKGGVWTPAMPCPEGQVCTLQGSTPACQAIAEVCKGSANMGVCDGQGVLYRCDAVGVATSQDTCRTPQLCQASIAGRACLKCMPDEHRCSGAMLERCAADGSGFVAVKTCTSAALCNPSLRDCTTQACAAASFHCQGDNLQRCNAGQTGYDLVKACRPGLCSEARGQCDECVPNATACEADVSTRCSVDGRTLTRTACASPTNQCVGVGRCVQCGSDADCPDPGVCKTRRCNLATGMCAPTNQAARTSCGTNGLCDGAGACAECLADADCPNPGDCRTRSCNTSTHRCEPKNIASGTTCSAGVCNGSGACVGCTTATVSRCTAMTCQSASCVDGQCSYTRTATGQRGNCASGQVCSAAASCVECTADSHCQGKGFDGPCSTARCMTGGRCGAESRNGLQCGRLMVCAGNECVGSCGNGTVNSDAQEQCEVGLSGSTDWTCNRTTCQRTGLPNTGLGLICQSKSDCPGNLICDGTLQGNGVDGMCLPPCNVSSNTCSLPTGYTGTCTNSSFGGALAEGCLVDCPLVTSCPGGSTCSALRVCLTL